MKRILCSMFLWVTLLAPAMARAEGFVFPSPSTSVTRVRVNVFVPRAAVGSYSGGYVPGMYSGYGCGGGYGCAGGGYGYSGVGVGVGYGSHGPAGSYGYGGGYPGWRHGGGCYARARWCKSHHRCCKHRKYRAFSLNLGIGWGGFNFGLGIRSVSF